jgi:hypothetical protein
MLARMPWVMFIFTRAILRLFTFYPGFCKRKTNILSIEGKLVIEAGISGWNSIEFKELFLSASDFFAEYRVEKLIITKSEPYILQVKNFLKSSCVTHYFYDPRTGNQDSFRAIYEAIYFVFLITRYRIVPIVYLTDIALRTHRCQAAIVTALSGVVVSFMLPKHVKAIFPHNRLIGPSLMPLSNFTLDYLRELRGRLLEEGKIKPILCFAGSLYEPRTSFLNGLKNDLSKTNHTVEIYGRQPGGVRIPDAEYWYRISSAQIVITTAEQSYSISGDALSIPQLVYRYIEVLAAGSLLLAPNIPGVARYFQPDVHFVSYENLADAAFKARFYLDRSKDAEVIRYRGHERAAALIRSNVFWLQIENALSVESIIS